MTDKRALRAAARARRDAFVTGSPAPVEPDARFRSRLSPEMVVAAYSPIGSEADPGRLVDAARAAGCRIALPLVTDRATPLRFLSWDGDAPLLAGPYGLANPDPRWEDIAPDVILAPVLAFDAALNRLGQGAGHYDRAFAALPDAWRVGVAWSAQEVPALPVDPWDAPLHAIATETTWMIR